MEGPYFNGCVIDDEKCPSAGQFLKIIEDISGLTEDERKTLILERLKSPAQEQIEPKLKLCKTWKSVKKLFLNQFRRKLDLKAKIHVRRSLRQRETESCQDFLHRCTKGQYLLCDDKAEDVLDRDILITFVSGLRGELYHPLVLDHELSDLNECVLHVSRLEKSNIFGYTTHMVSKTGIKAEDVIENESVKKEVIIDEDGMDDIEPKTDELEPDEDELLKVEQTEEDEGNYDMDYNSDHDDEDIDYNPSSEDHPEPSKLDKSLKNKEPPMVKIRHCSICQDQFDTMMKLKYHEHKVHGKELRYKGKIIVCEPCQIPLRRQELPKHDRLFHPEKCNLKSEPLYCDICPNAKFNYNRTNDYRYGELNLALHKAFVHRVKEPNPNRSRFDKDFICPKCDQAFTKSMLRHHLKTVHFQMDVEACHKCGKFFSDLKLHFRQSACSRGTLIRSCEHCSMTFTGTNSHKSLQSHLMKVHEIGIDTTVYTCQICGKFCKSKALLSNHMITHNDKDIICDTCGKGYKSKYHLIDHQRSHREKTLNCLVEECSSMFVSKIELNRHMKLIHSKKHKKKMQEGPKHKCDECPKEYNQPSKLRNHIAVVHRGEKPFQCNQCDLKFSYSNSMKEHIETVHEGIMFICQYPGCLKQMNRIANLNKHMKTAHGRPLPNEIDKKTILVDWDHEKKQLK